MEPVTIILALCIPLAFGVGWRVGHGNPVYWLEQWRGVSLCRDEDQIALDVLQAAEAKRHTQRMAALAKANAANRAKRDAS